jgi:hypothetical protein
VIVAAVVGTGDEGTAGNTSIATDRRLPPPNLNDGCGGNVNLAFVAVAGGIVTLKEVFHTGAEGGSIASRAGSDHVGPGELTLKSASAESDKLMVEDEDPS